MTADRRAVDLAERTRRRRVRCPARHLQYRYLNAGPAPIRGRPAHARCASSVRRSTARGLSGYGARRVYVLAMARGGSTCSSAAAQAPAPRESTVPADRLKAPRPQAPPERLLRDRAQLATQRAVVARAVKKRPAPKSAEATRPLTPGPTAVAVRVYRSTFSSDVGRRRSL